MNVSYVAYTHKTVAANQQFNYPNRHIQQLSWVKETTEDIPRNMGKLRALSIALLLVQRISTSRIFYNYGTFVQNWCYQLQSNSLSKYLPQYDADLHDPLHCLDIILLDHLTIERFAFSVPWVLHRTRSITFMTSNKNSSCLWSIVKPSPSSHPTRKLRKVRNGERGDHPCVPSWPIQPYSY
jgi:hypothetical protein